MTRRRVFLAINLPEKIKKRLAEYREKYDNLPVRWTKEASLHLTLVFIGYVDDEQVLAICQAARQVTKNFESFELAFKKMLPGPADKPRMIWVEGEKNKDLADLKNQLEDSLLNVNSGFLKKERQVFSPHITLARLNQNSRNLLQSGDLGSVAEEIKFQVPVMSVELMESDLRGDGAEYVILESFPLGEGEDF